MFNLYKFDVLLVAITWVIGASTVLNISPRHVHVIDGTATNTGTKDYIYTQVFEGDISPAVASIVSLDLGTVR